MIPLPLPFLYDPREGNLLLDLFNLTAGFFVLSDYVSAADDGMSRVVTRTFPPEQTAGSPTGLPDSGGLVTRFGLLPEPAAGGLGLAAGLALGLLGRRRRRRRRSASAALLLAGLAMDAGARELVYLEEVISSAPSAGLTTLTQSADGRHVYTTRGSYIFPIYARDAASGDLSFQSFYLSPDPLDNPRSAAMSPDGRHLYVGNADTGLGVFARDAGTGGLAFVERQANGMGGVTTGLTDIRGILVSADGRHVYASSVVDNAVVAFSRDAGDGSLTFLEAEIDGSGGVAGLTGPHNLAISADGRHLYAGSNGTGNSDETIAWFSRNPTTGAIAFGGFVQSGMGGVPSSSLLPMAIELSPDGAHLYASFSGGNDIGIFARDPGSGALGYLEAVDGGASTTTPFALDTSADGRRLYAASSAGWEVVIWERDPATGLLSLADEFVDGLLGLTQFLQLSPDGAHLYAGNLASPSIHSFATAQLQLVQQLEDGVAGVDGLFGASFVTVSPDGAHVYASGTAEGEVAIFERDGETNELTPLGVVEIAAPRGLATSPSGAQVYVVSGAGVVATFARNATTGSLEFVEDDAAPLAFATPWAATVSPDGRQVYVASRGAGGGVTSFNRNASTGGLTFATGDDDNDTPEIAGARDVAVSRDGKHIYVAAADAHSVVVYERDLVDPASGFIGLLEIHTDGVNGPGGTPQLLGGATAVAVSADGRHVYVASGNDDAVAVFARDAATGLITPTGGVVDGLGLFEGLDGARDLALSPDGALLYAIGLTDDSIAVLRRADDGHLGFAQVETDGVDGVSLLHLPSGLAVSPDGRGIYVVGGDEALVAFAPEPGSGAAAALGALAALGVVARRLRSAASASNATRVAPAAPGPARAAR